MGIINDGGKNKMTIGYLKDIMHGGEQLGFCRIGQVFMLGKALSRHTMRSDCKFLRLLRRSLGHVRETIAIFYAY